MKTINFNDKKFESYIRKCLAKPSGDITEADMAKIQYLDLAFETFADITPIVYCQNLREINLPKEFSATYDVTIFANVPSIHTVSVVNPKELELIELSEYVYFETLNVIYWGDSELCDLNAFTAIKHLNILNFTGKPFSCKKIQNISGLRSLRLCSKVEDVDVLNSLPELKSFKAETERNIMDINKKYYTDKSDNTICLRCGEEKICTLICNDDSVDLCCEIVTECFCADDQVETEGLFEINEYTVDCQDIVRSQDTYLASDLTEILKINPSSLPKVVLISAEHGSQADVRKIIDIMAKISFCFTSEVKVAWVSSVKESINGDDFRVKIAFLK